MEQKTVKMIGRISQKGKEYLQTAIHEEGKEENTFIPVFLKKGVEKLNYISSEKKVDKLGKVYTLYEVDAKNVYFPEKRDENDILKAIVTK